MTKSTKALNLTIGINTYFKTVSFLCRCGVRELGFFIFFASAFPSVYGVWAA